MAGDLFRLNRPFHLLDGFYTEWSEHLTKNCLPLFRDFPPSAVNNRAVYNDLISYYDTIDHYANRDTIFYFLFPSWRVNSLETSVLFLGDIHPHLFISLIQSFRDPNRSHGDLAAWRALAFPAYHFVDNIKNGISNTVFRLLHEMKEAQEGFIQSCSDNWVSSFHSQRGRHSVTVMETVASVTLSEEFVRIFREANQMRKVAIRDIVNLSNVDQAAVFLEGVCEFLAGFRHQQMMQQQYAAQLPPPPLMMQHQPERLHDICVWNIDPNVTRDMLWQMFRRYPSVREVRIENDTRRRQRHGFVSFADESEKWRAIQEMNGAPLLNRPMHIRSGGHSNI
ncbi:RNA recognition motif domain-containing protein [Hirschfeldia incana]|nr:RNA recognition motif domain-containing protein [Hirschfeldia incana]